MRRNPNARQRIFLFRLFGAGLDIKFQKNSFKCDKLRDRKVAMKFERTRMHFAKDFFAAFAVVRGPY